MASRRSSRSGRDRPGLGCLLWLAALILIFVVFFLNLATIRETLTRTGFSDLVRGTAAPSARSPLSSEPSTPESSTVPANADQGAQSGDIVVEGDGSDGSAGSDSAIKPGASGSGGSGASGSSTTSTQAVESKPATGTGTATGAAKPAETKPAMVIPAKTRVSTLYFVRIDDDGVMARVESKRVVPATDAPLTDAINALLAGPDERDVGKQLITLVPEGTRLLSARVSGSTATLNFSEAFERGTYGVEGYAGQLKQIVYTATAFPNVTDVRILIEGERRDFLAGESIYIGAPLSRNSF